MMSPAGGWTLMEKSAGLGIRRTVMLSKVSLAECDVADDRKIFDF